MKGQCGSRRVTKRRKEREPEKKKRRTSGEGRKTPPKGGGEFSAHANRETGSIQGGATKIGKKRHEQGA